MMTPPSPTSIEQLVASSSNVAMAHSMGRLQLEVCLYEIRVDSVHAGFPKIKPYVKVYVDERQLYRTLTVPNDLEPTWTFTSPVRMRVYPASRIRFSLHIRHTFRPDTCVGNVVGTAWTFLSDAGGPTLTDAKSPSLTLGVDVRIKGVNFESAPVELEQVMHDFSLRSAQASRRLTERALRGPFKYQDKALEYVEDILDILSVLSPIFHACKVVVVLVKIVRQVLKAQQEIHAAIRDMFRHLREVAAKAIASCGVHPLPGGLQACQRVIDVAGRSAEIVDGWLDSVITKRAVKHSKVRTQIKQCQDELENVQQSLQFDLDLALYQLASHNRLPHVSEDASVQATPSPHQQCIMHACRRSFPDDAKGWTQRVRANTWPAESEPPEAYLKAHRSLYSLSEQHRPSQESSYRPFTPCSELSEPLASTHPCACPEETSMSFKHRSRVCSRMQEAKDSLREAPEPYWLASDVGVNVSPQIRYEDDDHSKNNLWRRTHPYAYAY